MEFFRPEYWVVFPFSRGSSQPRDWTQVSCMAGSFFSSCALDHTYWNLDLDQIGIRDVMLLATVSLVAYCYLVDKHLLITSLFLLFHIYISKQCFPILSTYHLPISPQINPLSFLLELHCHNLRVKTYHRGHLKTCAGCQMRYGELMRSN